MQEKLSAVKDYLLSLQNGLCRNLEDLDATQKFITDDWRREQGGGGISRVLQAGEMLESAGVNFSHVFGDNLPESATKARPDLKGCNFEAMGVSTVIHPSNPYCPTSHMNVRCFVATKPDAEPVWWFGGGFDMTPFYPFEEDCVHWHKIAKQCCQKFGDQVYPKFKHWADKYFYLPHRKEPRGIGGLFFDDLNTQMFGWDFDTCFNFIRSVGEGYYQALDPILKKRNQSMYGEQERCFQLYRRGRYVEFNLLYDRGTLFGLQSGGRTESILMSMPPLASWAYKYSPDQGTFEEELYKKFLINRDWV